MNLTEVAARVNPDGFVAQRFAQDFNGHGHWVLTYLDVQVGGLTVKILDDEAVADWTELVPRVGDQP